MGDEPFDDEAPSGDVVTAYDVSHAALYIQLMDADAAGLDWQRTAVQLFGLDVDRDASRAQRVVESHMRRALWMRDVGYKGLLAARPS